MKARIKELIVEALIAGAIVLLVYKATAGGAVSELRNPPMPPKPMSVEQLKPAIDLICIHTVTRAIQRDSKQSENVANAFRQIGRVFEGMQTNVNYSVEYASKEIHAIQFPPEAPEYAEHVRGLIVMLYRVAYAERNSAEMIPTEWLWKICKLFRDSISTGLKDAGREGV